MIIATRTSLARKAKMEEHRKESKVHVPIAVKMKDRDTISGAADKLYSDMEAGGGNAAQRNLQLQNESVEETQCFLAICDEWCDRQVNKCCRSNAPPPLHISASRPEIQWVIAMWLICAGCASGSAPSLAERNRGTAKHLHQHS